MTIRKRRSDRSGRARYYHQAGHLWRDAMNDAGSGQQSQLE
jgi:hypothetical protein